MRNRLTAFPLQYRRPVFVSDSYSYVYCSDTLSCAISSIYAYCIVIIIVINEEETINEDGGGGVQGEKTIEKGVMGVGEDSVFFGWGWGWARQLGS